MKNKRTPFLAMGMLLSLLVWNACKMDPNWETDWEAPLAKVKLTPANIIPVGNVVADGNGDLKYVFDKPVFTLPVDSILKIPDTSLQYSFTAPIALNIQPGMTFQVFNNYLNFNITQAELLEALLSEGAVELEMFSHATQPLNLTVEIPKVTKNGTHFVYTDQISAAQNGNPALATAYKSLNGYTIDFTGDNGTFSNRIRLVIYATLPSDAANLNVAQGADLVGLTFKLKGMKPHFARGKIKTQMVDFSQDTLDIKALRIVKSGALQLQDLLMNLKVTNGVGVDLRVKINELKGRNTNTGNELSLQHPIIGGVININRAINQQWNNPEYISTIQNILFNASNSNLKAFVENIPDKISLKAEFTVNPQGPSAGGHDFIYGNSNSQIGLYIEAPLAFSMNNILLSDTVKLDMEKLLGKGNVKGIGFVLWAENNIPFEMKAQVYFEDQSGGVLDSLLFQNHLAPAVINLNNQSVSPVVSELSGALIDEHLENVKKAVRIRFKIKVNTSGQPGLTHWKDSYYLDLKLRGKLRYNI